MTGRTAVAPILVVGATGMMGGKIARALIADGAFVRAAARDRASAADLAAIGAEVVEVALADEESLERACKGVAVVISAVQGLHDVIVEGQTRLLRAAETTGVERFLPSDLSVDLFALNDGENRNLDLRRAFNRVLDESRVRGTSVLIGAFTEMVLSGKSNVDVDKGVVQVWGDATQPLDFTTTDDAARFVSAVALDDDAPRVLRFAGDQRNSEQLAKDCEFALGRPFVLHRAGDADDLAREIERERLQHPGEDGELFPRWQVLQYTHNAVTGRGKLSPLDNDRYPSIWPQSVRDFLAKSSASRAT